MTAFILLLCFVFAHPAIATETKTLQIVHSAADFRLASHTNAFDMSQHGVSPKGAAKTTRYLSPVLPAAFAFNAVGAHWLAETPGGSTITVFLRSSIDGQNWGKWLAIPHDEEPVAAFTEWGDPNRFAGEIAGALAFFNPESRFVQYRVDFSTTSAATAVLKRMSLQIIRSSDGPTIEQILKSREGRGERELSKSRSDAGKVAKPEMIKRSDWGAQAPRYDYSYTIVGHIAFHHTAGVSDYNVSTQDDCAARVRAIQSYHRNTLGWNDIGYAYAICKLGHIFQGREDDNDANDVRGAHDAFNSGSMGVANLGYFHPPYNHQPTPELLSALYNLLAWKCDERDIDPQGRSLYAAYGSVVDHIYGHQEVRATACPGDGLFPLKQSIKDSVQKIIEGVTTGIAEQSDELPDDFRIVRIFPNPFIPNAEGGVAKIRLRFQQPQPVELAIYNMLGQVVRVLHDGPISGGNLELQWNGKDARGRMVPAGVYFYRLTTSDKVEVAKVLLLGR